MWDIAPRNGTLDSNAGRNVKRSADVWGNARHFCDGELNFTPEFNYRIREKALRNESLDQNNAKDCLQSCGYSGKRNFTLRSSAFLPFRVQLHRMWDLQDWYTHQSDSQCGSDFLCTHKKIISLKVKKLFCSSKLFMVYYIHHTTYFKGEESWLKNAVLKQLSA